MVTVKKEALTTLVFTGIKIKKKNKKKNARLPSSYFTLFCTHVRAEAKQIVLLLIPHPFLQDVKMPVVCGNPT